MAKSTKKSTPKTKPEHGARKNAARKLFAKFGRGKHPDRGAFIAGVVKVGATDGTARVWWQQFRSGASPVTVS